MILKENASPKFVKASTSGFFGNTTHSSAFGRASGELVDKPRSSIPTCCYLPVIYRSGARLLQVEAVINRLVKRHGLGIWGDFAVDLKIYGVPEQPQIPDGLYLIKDGNREVWRRFRVKRKWRESQGIIHGKRCGTTQNLGPAARRHAAAKREKA